MCFASGYDAPPTSKHHVMRLLTERNTVLWVNYHASRRPRVGRMDLAHAAGRLCRVLDGRVRARRNLYVLTPFVLPLPGRAWAGRLNCALLSGQIHAALRSLRAGPLQIWSFCPDISYLLGCFEVERILYYCVDDFASFDGYDRDRVLRDEADLCRRADLVVASSRVLYEAKLQLNRRTIFVPHGVDFAHFAGASSRRLWAPPDISCISRPRIGFFGLIREWVDMDLVAAVAVRRPRWHFVFLGDSTVDVSAVRRLDNVHFLGAKPYRELPMYCAQMDAAIIPFKVNELTRAANPIKLREYLAAGLGVVSTPLPEVQAFGRLVEIADSPEGFEAAIQRVLHAGSRAPEERTQAMRQEAWPLKLEEICGYLMAECDGARRESMRHDVGSLALDAGWGPSP